jgi:hypothetical protein
MNRGRLLIPCSEAHRLLSDRLDGTLPSGGDWRLRLHLLFCDACSRVERQLDLIRSAMRRLGS